MNNILIDGHVSDTGIMDKGRLTDAIVRALPAPDRGNKIRYERGTGAIRGFGVRVTAAGVKSFVINYMISGRERRYTIGSYPSWSVAVAREEAKRLRREIDRGVDPLGERESERAASTINHLCDRYLAEYAYKKRSQSDDASMIRRLVRRTLGSRKVASISYTDIDRLHGQVTVESGPVQANRLLGLLSKMFSLAIRWEMRTDNPVKGVARNQEMPRQRYLDTDEMRRLYVALNACRHKKQANAIWMLLLTGCRLSEALAARWTEFQEKPGFWLKPSAHTKTKRQHSIPLSTPMQLLLAEIEKEAGDSPFLFPARIGSGHTVTLDRVWREVREAAGIEGAHLHDLRHSHASVLASAGFSLPLIGQLLGHTQIATTLRYSHLHDDALRAAVERGGAIISGAATGGEAEILPLDRRAQ
jgi:integrase